MSADKAPAFQWYPKEYLSSAKVAAMTLEQEGAYRRLLDYCWLDGSLPDDINLLAALCRVKPSRMKKLWEKIRDCFTSRNGTWIHERLDEERNKQDEWRRKSSEGGKHSAESRKRAKDGLRVVEPPYQPNVNQESSGPLQPNVNTPSPSPSPTPIKNVRTAPAALDVRFEAFWSAYPKKTGKKEALKAWNKVRPSETLADTILAAVEKQKQSAQWQKDGGQFIPNPATWLNQGRWDDELPIGEPPALSAARSSNRTQGNIAAMEAFIARHSQKALPQ